MAAIAAPRAIARADASTTSPATRNLWAIALTVTMATFMELLDTSISNVSLPHIAGGLGASYDESTWILTSYLVANAVILPMSAWLSRVFGRKRYYMMSVALFTITSFLCRIAPSLSALIVFRVLQGVGGGGLAPVEQAILVDTFPKEKLAGAFALYTTMLERRTRYHQSVLVSHLTSADGAVQQFVNQVSHYLLTRGTSGPDAIDQSYGLISSQMTQQATMLAAMDCFHLLGVAVILGLPLAITIQRFEIGKAAGAAH
jgi:hypothetical protein